MKTLAQFFLGGALLFCFGYAHAQSAARSTKEVVETVSDTTLQITATDTIQTDYRSERGISTPPHIEKLLAEGKITQALNEFEKFKASQKKANPYHLLYCEMTIYQQAQMGDPANSATYAQKANALRQELIAKYPNMSDTYLLQIDENTPNDKIVELTTKAIELDPDNINAYDYRGHALYMLKQIKEACADFEKLPWKGNMPEYWQCKDLK